MERTLPHIWVQQATLTPVEQDCICTIVLKILDGKCKMSEAGSQVGRQLYHHLPHPRGALCKRFDSLIRQALAQGDKISDSIGQQIHQARLFAESGLEKSQMKQFKARLKQEGLLKIDSTPP
uniref:Uncharacterized protein n=1 Tax=Magnetococcus massalia (strain MO-1) TaxID=451514 RepID=A0A1S7LJD4_MAGMO|nr:conserved protein of unknown function [Candidatus Magnetococcus massalia]